MIFIWWGIPLSWKHILLYLILESSKTLPYQSQQQRTVTLSRTMTKTWAKRLISESRRGRDSMENTQPYLFVAFGRLGSVSCTALTLVNLTVKFMLDTRLPLYFVWQLQFDGGQNKLSICGEELWWGRNDVWNRLHPWAMAAPRIQMLWHILARVSAELPDYIDSVVILEEQRGWRAENTHWGRVRLGLTTREEMLREWDVMTSDTSGVQKAGPCCVFYAVSLSMAGPDWQAFILLFFHSEELI